MAAWLKLIVVVIPLLIELVRMFKRHGLEQEAAKEVADDLQLRARVLVAEATAARASVDHSPDSVQNDIYNRD